MTRARFQQPVTGVVILALVLVAAALAVGFGLGRITSTAGDAPGERPGAGPGSAEPGAASLEHDTAATATDAPAGNVPEAGADLYAPPTDLPGVIDTVVGSTILVRCGEKDEGSGVVLDAGELSGQRRIVVTNEHVIEGCEKSRTVRINAQGARLKGTVVAWDAKRDLAVLDVPELNLPALPISTTAAAGQWVMAAGAPLSYRNSISIGVVSAVVPKDSTITTDAVIGPGSSGGPVVNARGQIIGINAAVWKAATGISLATQVEALCMKVLECSSD